MTHVFYANNRRKTILQTAFGVLFCQACLSSQSDSHIIEACDCATGILEKVDCDSSD